MQIGERLRELREKRGWTQGDVERLTGMLRAYISRVEHGHTVPSLDTVERFAAVLGVPIHELFRVVPTTGEQQTASPLIDLLSEYVRNMGATDRELLLMVAEHLAK